MIIKPILQVCILGWIPLGYFILCSPSYVFWEIDFYISADQVFNSLAKWVLDLLCSIHWSPFSGASKILAHFQWRATTNIDSCELLCAYVVHSEKQVRAYVMPFNQEWCMPRNMQAPPVNKDSSNLDLKRDSHWGQCTSHCEVSMYLQN
jgi:hypothetical protein